MSETPRDVEDLIKRHTQSNAEESADWVERVVVDAASVPPDILYLVEAVVLLREEHGAKLAEIEARYNEGATDRVRAACWDAMKRDGGGES